MKPVTLEVSSREEGRIHDARCLIRMQRSRFLDVAPPAGLDLVTTEGVNRPRSPAHPSRIADFTFARSPRSNVTSVSCPTVANAAR